MTSTERAATLASLDAGMQIEHDGRRYQILAVAYRAETARARTDITVLEVGKPASYTTTQRWGADAGRELTMSNTEYWSLDATRASRQITIVGAA